MSLPHFFAGAPDVGGMVALDDDETRHATRSLRLRPGDELTSSDGAGALVRCRVTVIAPRVQAEVLDRSAEQPASPQVAVLLAAPKGERLSWAVQKLTEIGVDELVILEAARSVRRWEGQERGARALARFEAIAREAAKQSRRRFLPRVEGPLSWDEAVDPLRRPTVVLWERAETPLAHVLPEATTEVALVIGPEGGIPEEDALAARDRGAALASLGPMVLRTETAALAAAALTLARYGRLG